MEIENLKKLTSSLPEMTEENPEFTLYQKVLQLSSENKERLKKEIESQDLLNPIAIDILVFEQNPDTKQFPFNKTNWLKCGKAGITTPVHLKNAEEDPRLKPYFGMEYNPQFCPSVPRYILVITCTQPEHRSLNRDDRYPLRCVMVGDDEEIVSKKKELLRGKCCIFCLGHHLSNSCPKYSTPSQRHVRFRHINYTLRCLRVLQICPACVCREIHHPMYEKCLARRSCANCTQPGHDTSLCTTAVSVIARASNKQVVNQNIVTKILKDDRFERESHQAEIDMLKDERNARMTDDFIERLEHPDFQDSESEAAHDDEQDNAFESRLLNPHLGDDVIVSSDICIDAEFMDLHSDHIVREEVALMDPIISVPMEECFDKSTYATLARRFLNRFGDLMNCSRLHCSTGKKAVFFCKCGRFGLCPAHTLGRSNLKYRKQDPRKTRCPRCMGQVPIPRGAAITASEKYYEILEDVSNLQSNLEVGLTLWENDSTPAPSRDAFENHVAEVVLLQGNQFLCPKCRVYMDCETHLMMKSGCSCGYIVCRSCLIEESQFAEIVKGNLVPVCSDYLDGRSLFCHTCEMITGTFGCCAGMTLTAWLCRLLIGEDTAQGIHPTMRALFVASMADAHYNVEEWRITQPFDHKQEKNRNVDAEKELGNIYRSNERVNDVPIVVEAGIREEIARASMSPMLVTLTDKQKKIGLINQLLIKHAVDPTAAHVLSAMPDELPWKAAVEIDEIGHKLIRLLKRMSQSKEQNHVVARNPRRFNPEGVLTTPSANTSSSFTDPDSTVAYERGDGDIVKYDVANYKKCKKVIVEPTVNRISRLCSEICQARNTQSYENTSEILATDGFDEL